MGETRLRAVVFEDGRGELGPLTDLRASFEVRTGALTTLERLQRVMDVVGVWARPEIVEVTRERVGVACNDAGALGDDVVLINGRAALPVEGVESLRAGEAIVASEGEGGEVVLAARLGRAEAEGLLQDGGLGAGVARRSAAGAALLQRSWDVIRWRDAALDFDLKLLTKGLAPAAPLPGVTVLGSAVFLGSGARVDAGAILDARDGAIVLDAGAVVRPGAIVTGPAYIGAGSTVLERAHLKAHTAIGPVCKVGGEVGGTIFQGWANKAHEGHLGDSWVGEWANLGAGTTNSNLLNTYGEVVATVGPGRSRERTGLNFLGVIIGDHVKTAIMTRIMTGSVFGTGAMIAHPAPVNVVQRFDWLTAERRQSFRFEKFMEVARAMMARRKLAPSEAVEARLGALHRQTPGVGA